MGNNMSNNNNHNDDDHNQGTYGSIPPASPPPSLIEIVNKSKSIASDYFMQYNPTSLENCLKSYKSLHSSANKKRIDLLVQGCQQHLSVYAANLPPYTEKTYQFVSPDSLLKLVISSNKNSDHTISYWLQYPVLDFHIKMAFLKLMNVQITPETLNQVTQRFGAVFYQAKKQLEKQYVKCEQLDPLYVNNVIGSLGIKGFTIQLPT